MNMMEEQPGSTRIVEIVPEGQRVKAGDVVCRLDSSSYDDEEKAQLIRYLQAKSYVEQANAILEVNLITLREFRDGIYPQDLTLVRQYIEQCMLEKVRLGRNVAWSRDMLKKGFRTRNQTTADEQAYQQADIALIEAQGMYARLKDQTGPKLLKQLEANVRAIQADKLTQDAAFSLEDQRLKRIKKNIANCTVRAPRDGIVVYANQANRWGTVTAPIDQGVTLRQDQPIFYLPDPKHMRVKAKINETKLTMIETGMPATIVIDAYPDRPVRGTVAEVTAISIPVNATDVRVYYANVDIIDGFDDLRPGLSAEIRFEVETRRRVTRVPLESIRWVGEEAFVAVYDGSLADAGKVPWQWRPIEVGLSNAEYAEVLSGLKTGDRIVAIPRELPAPKPEPKPSAEKVAEVSPKTRG
jgi:multidrug resistance efflux pump